eukprot:1118023-Rhodomonas_salina.6
MSRSGRCVHGGHAIDRLSGQARGECPAAAKVRAFPHGAIYWCALATTVWVLPSQENKVDSGFNRPQQHDQSTLPSQTSILTPAVGESFLLHSGLHPCSGNHTSNTHGSVYSCLPSLRVTTRDSLLGSMCSCIGLLSLLSCLSTFSMLSSFRVLVDLMLVFKFLSLCPHLHLRHCHLLFSPAETPPAVGHGPHAAVGIVRQGK